jgi:hypothetical protein
MEITKHDFEYHAMADDSVELHVKANNVRFAISFNLGEMSFEEGMKIAMAKVKEEIRGIKFNVIDKSIPPS